VTRYLFAGVTVFDGSGSAPFPGEVLIEGPRIRTVAAGRGAIDAADAVVIDGSGCTLMPGLVEAHAHVSFTHPVELADIGRVPPEENTLIAAYNARTLLDAGFTSAYSAGSAKPRIDVVIRNEIDAGRLPGPRMRAASPEITSTGGFGDVRQAHLEHHSVEVVADGPVELRRVVRWMAREGVDTIKMNLSGDNASGRRGFSEKLAFADDEVAAAAEAARAWGLDLACHAQAADAVRMAMRHGFRTIYHCAYADEDALDALEARKDAIFVAPAVGLPYATAHDAAEWGFTPEVVAQRGTFAQLERYERVFREMRRRNIRVLPGGDYGFAWNPIGTNARDLEHFVRLFGYSPAEALRAATEYGGQLMGMGNELGLVREAYLADLLLVRGDPVADIALLQDRANLVAIMQDGRFHKPPPLPLAQRAGSRARRTTATGTDASRTICSATLPMNIRTRPECW
jgi:imidazolonepropionase-like amidohydrolase